MFKFIQFRLYDNATGFIVIALKNLYVLKSSKSACLLFSFLKLTFDSVGNESYSLLFNIHTTLDLTKFIVDDSSSGGIINGNSYSFFFTSF